MRLFLGGVAFSGGQAAFLRVGSGFLWEIFHGAGNSSWGGATISGGVRLSTERRLVHAALACEARGSGGGRTGVPRS